MKKTFIFPKILLVIFISPFMMYDKYSPAPQGIAINSISKECGYYWGGDEYISYDLSIEWEIYYPNENNDSFETKYGNCAIDDKFTYENCCKQLGFKYIPGNLGEVLGIRKESDLLKTKISNLKKNISNVEVVNKAKEIDHKAIIFRIIIIALGITVAFLFIKYISKIIGNKKGIDNPKEKNEIK